MIIINLIINEVNNNFLSLGSITNTGASIGLFILNYVKPYEVSIIFYSKATDHQFDLFS